MWSYWWQAVSINVSLVSWLCLTWTSYFSLVFSQSLYSLDVIEHFLNYIDEQTQHNSAAAAFTGSWSLGQDYFRLDGSTPVEQRNSSCKHFNSPSNPRARLFLISTRAGGLGINLVAANRVIIFDVSWNPSHDIQSIFRVYRFGQNKPCYIYRFLALGTMEEKIYERQVTKQAISKRVIDEQVRGFINIWYSIIIFNFL